MGGEAGGKCEGSSFIVSGNVVGGEVSCQGGDLRGQALPAAGEHFLPTLLPAILMGRVKSERP